MILHLKAPFTPMWARSHPEVTWQLPISRSKIQIKNKRRLVLCHEGSLTLEQLVSGKMFQSFHLLIIFFAS